MVAQQGETVQRIDADTSDIANNVGGAQRELLRCVRVPFIGLRLIDEEPPTQILHEYIWEPSDDAQGVWRNDHFLRSSIFNLEFRVLISRYLQLLFVLVT